MNLEDFRLDGDGFEIVKDFLTPESMASLRRDIDTQNFGEDIHGLRNANTKIPCIDALVNSDRLKGKAASYLGSSPDVVRVILFDKTAARNWLVSWHQDKTIAVNTRMDIPNWGPWSIKDGQVHVQPDVDILEKMVTFRLHLDDTSSANGCLRVIPKSHRHGILDSRSIDQLVAAESAVACAANAGDLLVMRPHLLHASSKGTLPSRRRIVHIEYSNAVLPSNLTWARTR